MNGTQDKYVTYIYICALVELLAFGLEGLLCRHNEPVSEQHDGLKTKGFLYFTITVREFSPVHSRVIDCHDYATLVDGVF